MRFSLKPGGFRVAILAALVAIAPWPALALPLITDAVVLDGADPAELPPKFTGQTFDHPNEGAGFTVPAFDEDVPTFNDRSHEWNGASTSVPIPRYLVGGEYLMFPNDDRDNDPYLVEVTLSEDADVYLLIDNRHPDGVNTTPPNIEATMLWVTDDGWEPVLNGLNRNGDATVPDEVGVDESGDGTGPGNGLNQWSSVYHRRILAGTFTLGTPENSGRNMYGVVVQPVPQAPFVSAASGDLLGVVFEVSNGSRSNLKRDSVRLAVDGVDVTGSLQVSALGNVTRIRYRLATPFPSETAHTAVLTFTDDAATPVETTDTLEFVAEYYATLTAADAAPAGSVNTSISGFSARIVQARDTAAWPGADLPNSTLRAELQLAGLLRDPVNGQFLANLALPGPNSDGTYTAERINWNQEANPGGTLVEIGNFQSGSTPSFPDEEIPGVPGTDPESSVNLDNIAAEVVGYLELSAGLHRLGVNSDDGFRLTAGADPADPSNVVLGEFNGGRGSADSLFYVAVDAAGIYPVRLVWYEGGGGANLEFFSVHQPNPEAAMELIPVNTRSNPNGITSYARASAALAPAASVYPLPNATGVPADARIQAVLRPRGSAANSGSVSLQVNGQPAAVTTQSVAGGLLVEHVPTAWWPAGVVAVELSYADAAGSSTTVNWEFEAEDYQSMAVIPASYAVPAGSVNTSASGFIVDEYQMWDGFSFTPVARTGFADNNSAEAAELQIARGYLDPATGEPYYPFTEYGENADGTFNIELVNWNQVEANAGDFNAGNGYADALIPGLTFAGDVDENNWIVAECLTYLDLKRGRYQFGVNSDDGFKVTSAPNPGDVIGTQLGIFNTGRGAANSFFPFYVEQDGIYPFRLLWWEGTGGASVEFKSQDAVSLAQTLINDRTRTSGIRAYRTYTGTPIPRIAGVAPVPASVDVPADTAIAVELENLGATAVQMKVNGNEVTPQRTTSGTITTLTYQPPQPFPFDAPVEVSLGRSGTTTTWTFTTGSGAANLLTVEVSSPADGATFPDGTASVTLTAAATAQGGTVTSVEFYDGAGRLLGTDTSAPYEYVWTGILAGRHTVTAQATDNRGLVAVSEPVGFQVGEPIAVNFQATSAEVPEGYLPDYGDVYDDRGNGQSYGWDFDNLANSRDRNDSRSPDERYDTFNHMQKPAPAGTLWEIAVPNGWYNVFLVAGEASNIDSVYNVQAEGVTIVQGTPTDAVRWYEGSGAVQVEDGRLSIGNGPGSSNNKVCFVEIYTLPSDYNLSPPELGAPVLSGTTLTITWTGGGTLESAPAVAGPWTSTGDSDGSYSEAATAAAGFYRVRR